MNKTKILQMIGWAALGVYSFFAYHLLLIPFLLDFSLIGVLIGWGSLLALFFIIPKTKRKSIVIYILLFILTITAIENIGFLTNFTRYFYFGTVMVAVYFIGRLYGKLSSTTLLTLLITVSIINVTIESSELKILNHFTKLWESPKLYTGDTVDYFPLTVRDIDNDGQDEIITFGHRRELVELYQKRVEKGLDPNRMPYDIEEEKLFLYVYKWNGDELERVDNDSLNIEEIRPFIPKDYIGFPFYVWQDDFTLVPQTQLQPLAEQTGKFGTSPLYIFQNDIIAINEYLKIYDGVYDKLDTFRYTTDVQSIIIQNGQLVIEYNNNDVISMKTNATKIINLIQTEDGLGLLLLSDQLELWNISDPYNMELTHTLTENEIADIMRSEYIVADVEQDGVDEVLISGEPSRIIKPLQDGEWDILFTSRDLSLRFEAFNSLGVGQKQSIIALSKSRYGSNPLRFITGFTYTEKGLKQDWKSYLSLINVRSADITGDGQNELVATIWKSHKIYVFSKHHVPVTTILLSIFGCLVLYTIYLRRKSNA